MADISKTITQLYERLTPDTELLQLGMDAVAEAFDAGWEAAVGQVKKAMDKI